MRIFLIGLGIAFSSSIIADSKKPPTPQPAIPTELPATPDTLKETGVLHSLLPGHYSNYEQVTFGKDAGQDTGPAVEMDIVATSANHFNLSYARDGKIIATTKLVLQATGDGAKLGNETCAVPFRQIGSSFLSLETKRVCSHAPAFLTAISAHGLTFRDAAGNLQDFRRAKSYTCWVSAPKLIKKADGSTDWAFMAGLKLHDQGGRIWTATDEPSSTKIGLKLRNVMWPSGTNKPALTLYVYKPEDTEKAVSYVWADPEAKLIGINLRWMQGSCSRDL
jgi:hypothetical protein